MGSVLVDQSEVLFRQIHPSCIHGGEPASDQFQPRQSDQGLLSVDRSALTDAQSAQAVYTAGGLQSGAVYGLTVGEFQDLSIECREDPLKAIEGRPDNPAHALADFTKLDGKQQRMAAKRLKRAALARGRLHP